MAETILIIEKERDLGAELRRHYESTGWDALLCDSIGESRRLILDEDLQALVILSEMNLPDGSALDLLEELNGARSGSEWIFLTSDGSVPDSVRASRLGAFDFLQKPCDQQRLDVVVNGSKQSAKARRRLSYQAEAGAFTGARGRRRGLFEQAHGGTLFLDQISQMDVEPQSKGR